MSVIRINPPGKPVEFIDLGPHSRGRVSVSPFQSMGSQLTVTTPLPMVLRKPAKAPAVPVLTLPSMNVPRCGFLMARQNEPCARRPHRGGCHRTALAVARDNARFRQR